MRWWWFTKAFKGTNSWTARCPRCHNGCAIVITKEFSRASKAWVIAAVLGIYLAVFGMAGGTLAAEDGSSLGLTIGIAGSMMFAVSLIAALVNDVLRSRVQLTAAVICSQCGERLPDDFASNTCPVCGAELAGTPIWINELPPS
jgi:Zn finger protein HypA/HybF involved in hydrogenase expression